MQAKKTEFKPARINILCTVISTQIFKIKADYFPYMYTHNS